MSSSSKVLSDAREVRHTGAESLHRREGSVDGAATCLRSPLDHFEKDEVGDARIFTTEEVFSAQVINKRFHSVHQRLDGDRLFSRSEKRIDTGGAVLVGDVLECKPLSALFVSSSKDSWAVLSSNVLMDGDGL